MVSASIPQGAAMLGFRPEDADIAGGRSPACGSTLSCRASAVGASFLYCDAVGSRVVDAWQAALRMRSERLAISASVLHWFDSKGKRVASRRPSCAEPASRLSHCPVRRLNAATELKSGSRSQTFCRPLLSAGRLVTKVLARTEVMTCVLGTDDASLAALLIASLAGDEKAYAAFLRQAARLVRAYVRRRTMQVA
jgi:hypothetical protein